jgi:hypothetical protein
MTNDIRDVGATRAVPTAPRRRLWAFNEDIAVGDEATVGNRRRAKAGCRRTEDDKGEQRRCIFAWRAREIVLRTKLRWYPRRGSVGAVVVVKVQLLPYDKP